MQSLPQLIPRAVNADADADDSPVRASDEAVAAAMDIALAATTPQILTGGEAAAAAAAVLDPSSSGVDSTPVKTRSKRLFVSDTEDENAGRVAAPNYVPLSGATVIVQSTPPPQVRRDAAAPPAQASRKAVVC